eukprot:Gb_21721 [translate_table: standard]
MPNNSGNGNVMVERSRVVAKVSSAFCRASIRRRLIDSMRCGASNFRHRRSASEEVLKPQEKSKIDAEKLYITIPKNNEASKDNAYVQTNSISKDPGVQSLEQEHKSVDSEPLGELLTNDRVPDRIPDRQSSKNNPEDQEWNRLVDCLITGSKECKARPGAMVQEIMTTEEEDEIEKVERKIKIFNELQSVVQMLQFGNENAQEKAAMDVRRLAKDDAQARVTLAMLGAIPPLVGMLDSPEQNKQISALFALLNLAIGNNLAVLPGVEMPILALFLVQPVLLCSSILKCFEPTPKDDVFCSSLCCYGRYNKSCSFWIKVNSCNVIIILKSVDKDILVNKAAIVKAGAVHKMVNLLQGSNESVTEAVVADFLSLSALDVNKPVIGSSGAIPFLVNVMQHGSSQGRKDALRALYNLSICHTNAGLIVGTNAVDFLLNTVEDMDVTEKVLGILSNLAATEDGRKAIGKASEAFPILVDVLNWADAPKCQEKAAYILMIMAHNSWSHRQAMVESGMVSSLLELTLLGTTLAQKRASRILECLREDRSRRTTPISAPITGQHTDIEAINKDENGDHMSEERRVVKRLVQQSLQHNMQRIIKRANLPQDFAPSDRFKSLMATSSSKSLPF